MAIIDGVLHLPICMRPVCTPTLARLYADTARMYAAPTRLSAAPARLSAAPARLYPALLSWTLSPA
jgi:hypothetical protein